VRPIVAGRLESQFGNGHSNQNAYILMYKQKNDTEIFEYEDIPDYWVEEIQKQNDKAKADRAAYEFERNHLEIYLQPQALFDIQEGIQIKYVDANDTEEQGLKIKFTFDTTVADLKTRIRQELSLDESAIFDAFEVCQLGNNLCQVFRALSDFSDENIISQTKITHFSTWLVTCDEKLIAYLQSVKGEEREPIFINYKYKDVENRFIMYRDMTCGDFVQKTAELYGFDHYKKIKCIYFADGIMRRLDRLKYDVEKQRDHTLKSLNLRDSSCIVVEDKSAEEIEIEEKNSSLPANFIDPDSTFATTSEQIINVDETENIRTVLMYKEEDSEFLERFNVDLNWTIGELHEKLKQYMGIDKNEDRRLKRLYDNSLIVKEELGVKLSDYPEFIEGGVRLRIEYGRFPSVEEIALNVALFQEPEMTLRFYFNKESVIHEGKEKMCKEFGVEPNKYRLWRTSFDNQPQYIVKKEKQHWEKNHIGNGDFLLLKSEQDILPDEQVLIDIHETKTGIANDCKNIGHLICKDSDTLDDLKDAILAMEEYREKPELNNFETDCIRLRARSRNLFFGRIFREKNKTLKNLKIKSGDHLVVQFLDHPENLKNNEIVLLLRKRDIKNMDYHEFVEFIYDHDKAPPMLLHLRSKISEKMGIPAENLAIAKYIPHAYDWKYWNPDEDVPVKSKGKKGGQKGKNNQNNQGKKNKGKKNKKNAKEEQKETPAEEPASKQEVESTETQPIDKPEEAVKEKQEFIKLSLMDLRSAPFLLAEGDILGVRDNSEEGAATDDFQTVADIQNRERLEELKKLDKDIKVANSKPSHNNDPFKIFTDF